jgi:hypothetical protein
VPQHQNRTRRDDSTGIFQLGKDFIWLGCSSFSRKVPLSGNGPINPKTSAIDEAYYPEGR